MNKKLTAFFTSYGMTVNGNFAYGNIHGYETNAVLKTFDTAAPLRIHISCYTTDDKKRIIESLIRNLSLKYFNMAFTSYGLLLALNDITYKRLINRLPALLETIFGILSENGATKSEFCPVCGNPLQESASKKCNIDGMQITIDNDCVEKINSVISAENQDFENAPNNYLKGFLGAFIGGLAGVAISVVLYLVGFISSISAVVAVMLGAFLYEKFQGKRNKMMIVIVAVTSLVMMAATVPCIYITAAGIAAKSEGVSLTAIEAFRICMDDPEFSRMFYCDLALVLLFTALGIGLEIFTLSQKIKRQKNI